MILHGDVVALVCQLLNQVLRVCWGWGGGGGTGREVTSTVAMHCGSEQRRMQGAGSRAAAGTRPPTHLVQQHL